MKSVCCIAVASCLISVGCGRDAASYVTRGNEFFDKGQYSEAILQYKRALQRDPNHGQAYYKLGLSQLNQNTAREAYNSFSRAVALLPKHEDALVQLGQLALDAYLVNLTRPQMLYDQLQKVSDELLRINPRSVPALRIKGYVAWLDRKPNESIEFLQRANDIKPLDPEIVLPLCQVLMQNQQFEEGEKLALSVIEKRKTVPEIYDALVSQYIAVKRFSDAETVLQKKIANNPDQPEFTLQLADFYRRQQKADRMEATIQTLLDNRSRAPRARLLAGQFYARSGLLDEALRQFESGLKDTPQDSLIYQKQITSALIAQGRKADAQRIVDEILQKHPTDAETLSLRAALLLDSDRIQDKQTALKLYEELAVKQPQDPGIRYELGRAKLALGDLTGARAEFETSLRQSPESIATRFFLVELAVLHKRFDDAFRHLSVIRSREPRNVKAMVLRAVALTGVGQTKEARSELEGLARTYPNLADIQLQLGLLNIAEKRYQAADEIFRRFYQPGKRDLRPLEGMVASQVAQNQIDRAMALLKEELGKSPNPDAVRVALASTAIRAGKYDVAREQYKILISQQPTSMDYHIRLGETCQLMNAHAEAVEAFRRAEALAPGNVLPPTHLGYVHAMTGDQQNSEAAYRRALKLKPNDPLVLNNLALLLAESNKNLDEALQMAERARKLLGDNAEVTDTLGWIYAKKGLHDSAMQIFSRLTQKHPNNPTFRYHFGAALLKQGDKRKAAAEFKAALANKPSKEEVAQIRRLMDNLETRSN